MKDSPGLANAFAREIERLKSDKAALLEALEKAEAHLEYCGYGDEYESQCARDEKLPQLIRAAIDKAK